MRIQIFKAPVRWHKLIVPILLAIFLISIAAKFKFIFQESFWPDEALYLFIARNLSHDFSALTDISGNFFYKNPPLLMYLLSLAAKIHLLDFDQIARMIILLMGVGTLVPVYFIGKKLSNPIAGIIAALFLSACPLSNWNSLRILTDVPVVFFIYLAIAFLLYDRKAAFFLFAICAIFTKYTAFPLLFLPLLIKLKPRIWISLYVSIVLALSIFVMINGYVMTNIGWVNYFSNFFNRPNFYQMNKETAYFLGFFLLAASIAGLYFSVKQEKYSAIFHWVCLFAIFRIFLPWMAFRVSRYTLPLYPGLYIFAAFGCYQCFMTAKIKWPNYQKWVGAFLILAIGTIIYSHSQKSLNLLGTTSKSFVGFKSAGEFLRTLSGPRTLATASPRQMKYFIPEFDIHDIKGNITPEEFRSFVLDNRIKYLSIDLWSPHLPSWCRSYNFQNKGYKLRLRKEECFCL